MIKKINNGYRGPTYHLDHGSIKVKVRPIGIPTLKKNVKLSHLTLKYD